MLLILMISCTSTCRASLRLHRTGYGFARTGVSSLVRIWWVMRSVTPSNLEDIAGTDPLSSSVQSPVAGITFSPP